jgi:hypothetical protein
METPVKKEKIGKEKKPVKKVTNLFEDMEHHPHNEKSYNKQFQKQNFSNKRGQMRQKV